MFLAEIQEVQDSPDTHEKRSGIAKTAQANF
jgi:hypothetical protein